MTAQEQQPRPLVWLSQGVQVVLPQLDELMGTVTA